MGKDGEEWGRMGKNGDKRENDIPILCNFAQELLTAKLA
jgi:hypothetical protein